MHARALAPAMGELNTANHLLGDQAALAEAFARDGYWFFRDVLDRRVIGEIREQYRRYLVEMGVAEADDPEARYNGADYSQLPINSNVTRLNEQRAHRLLHEAPTINAFFRSLFGCEPFWVPFTVHRTNPPVTDSGRSRFDFVHADSAYNEGLPFLICWVPLDDIDEAVGGLAVAEGLDGAALHPRDGLAILPIPEDAIPAGSWKRAHYRPGDVLIMSMNTPHSGLSNVSKDRFRFSMDTRIMPSTGDCPVVGSIESIDADRVTIAVHAGVRTLRFDDASFVRGHRGDPMVRADIPSRYSPGDAVIVAVDGDRVTNMRPQH